MLSWWIDIRANKWTVLDGNVAISSPTLMYLFLKNELDLSFCLVIVIKYFKINNHALDQDTTIHSCLFHNLLELSYPVNKRTTIFLPLLQTTLF